MTKEAMRQAMPTVAALVDELRPFLGKVIYASENGSVIDRREPVDPDSVFDIPSNYQPSRQVKEKK